MASETITPGRRRSWPSRRDGEPSATTVAVALTALAAAIRVPTLSVQSFWLDEGYTVALVRMSFGAMLRTIPRTESTPPLYYALAWAWTRVFGSSEFGLRSLSALAGIATIPVAWALARRLAGDRAALIAGLLLAVSPLMVWFSQEARAYALATLLATGTLLCIAAHRQNDRARWLWGWAACAALGIATHYFVAFVVAPEVVFLGWRARGDRRLWAASGLVLIVAVALVPLALAQRGTGHADYIAQGSLATRALQVPKQFLIGYASPAQTVTAVVAAAAVAAGALWPLAADGSAARRSRLPLAVGLAAVVVPILLALVGVDFLDTRNLLPALPALYVAAAIGFAADRAWPRSAALAGVLALIGIVVVVLVETDPRYQRADWRGAATALGAATVPRAIDVTPGSGLIPLQIYEPRLRALTAPVRVRELDVVAIPAQVTGGGIATPPRLARPLPVPVGFHLVRAVWTRTYTVLRYRAAQATVVGPALAGDDDLGPGSASALVQLPPRR